MSTAAEMTTILKNYTSGFHPVVPFNKQEDRLLLMDFTERNTDLSIEILEDTLLFSKYVSEQIKKAGARYGVGGYDEHRTIYKRSDLFSPSLINAPGGTTETIRPSSLEGEINLEKNEAEKWDERSNTLKIDTVTGGQAAPRRLHLGIDIWGPAAVPVYAPLEGTVHSFAFNDVFGDYGATLILQHELEGIIFHTLYGHLSLSSIADKREGQSIEKGQWIAAFGEPAENGHWPPHLHFQIIKDMEGLKGDYPGVCAYAEREKYLNNCLDPDAILEMIKWAGNE